VIMLRAGRPGFDSRQGLGLLFLHVQTGFGAHLASSLMGTGGGIAAVELYLHSPKRSSWDGA
jgi:uncharacterized membrane protein